MVGSAMERKLRAHGHENLVVRSRKELDLTQQAAVAEFFAEENLDVVILAAAKVGGIHANNTFPSEFLYENLMLEMNIIQSAFRQGVGRLLFLGSSCIYPRMAPQPIPEDSLLSGALEPTNEAYALAKISGLKYCSYLRRQFGVMFHSAMPTNLYGPGDNYHPENSHVLPALIRKFHEAQARGDSCVTIWGTGKPRREFLHVDDLADGLYYLLNTEDPPDWINIGSGEDLPILELAQMVAKVVGFDGNIEHDLSKPDGTPRKLMAADRIRELGWKPSIALQDGIRDAYQDFLKSDYREA